MRITSTKKPLHVTQDQRLKEFLPINKVAAFQQLFEAVCKEVGGWKKAIQLLHLSDRVIDEMRNQKRLSRDSGKKILAGYNKYCKNSYK